MVLIGMKVLASTLSTTEELQKIERSSGENKRWVSNTECIKLGYTTEKHGGSNRASTLLWVYSSIG